MGKFSFKLSFVGIMLLLVVAVLGLAACQQKNDGSNTLADALPLDPQKPTFVFFYTDG